jgi:hypothetical protein
MNPAWSQLATYLVSGTLMISSATWYLAWKIADIKVAVIDRLARVEARVDALERAGETLQNELRADLREIRALLMKGGAE